MKSSAIQFKNIYRLVDVGTAIRFFFTGPNCKFLLFIYINYYYLSKSPSSLDCKFRSSDPAVFVVNLTMSAFNKTNKALCNDRRVSVLECYFHANIYLKHFFF